MSVTCTDDYLILADIKNLMDLLITVNRQLHDNCSRHDFPFGINDVYYDYYYTLFRVVVVVYRGVGVYTGPVERDM